MVMIGFVIKIFKLGLIILNICYFLGLLWFIFCEVALDLNEDRWERKGMKDLPPEEIAKKNGDNFIEYY